MDNSTSPTLYEYALKRLEDSPFKREEAKSVEPVDIKVHVGEKLAFEAKVTF